MSTALPPATTRRRRLWTHAWQLATCHLIGFFCWGFGWEESMNASSGPVDTLMMFDAGIGLVLTQLILLRRRRPLLVAVVLVAAASLSAWALAASAVAVVHLGSRRRLTEILPVGVLWVVSSLTTDEFVTKQVTPEESLMAAGASGRAMIVTLVVLMYLVLAAIGWNRGAKAELVESWRAGAELARREQVARVAQAQTAERARIAREMHDVLAHKISLVSLHAGVLAYKDDLTREETAETAALIRETAHQALQELREVLGVLRDDGTEANTPPQPSLLDLPALVAAEEAAGSQVSLDVEPDSWQRSSGLSPTPARHAHRIIQEALTNARKHAQGQPVSVRVQGDQEQGLLVQVGNPLGHQRSRVPGAGMGLTGLCERATLAGGSLETEQSDGWFRVTARLPWNVRMGS
ncbi:sensor histidine kinase [Luteococcus peritonei]|uniref:histidine kinase n=1 Tax=Luteococcus peritonei TaxID=88874 RepID=A0ABW4RUY2_9ACTN